jgi:hypothetical protein
VSTATQDYATEIAERLAVAALEAIEEARINKTLVAADTACRLVSSYYEASRPRITNVVNR